MYKPFSDQNNVDKMVRVIEVFVEEITLDVFLHNRKYVPYKGFWAVKYVSSPTAKNKREIFLYWDTKTEWLILEIVIEKLLKQKGYFSKLQRCFFDYYGKFEKFTDKIYAIDQNTFKKQSNEQLEKLFKELCFFLEYAMFGYYIPYDLLNISIHLVKQELEKTINQKEAERIFEILSTTGIESAVNHEKKAFFKKLEKIQKNYKRNKNWQEKEIQSLIFKHWYDFGPIIYTHALNEMYTLDDYQKKFKKNINLNIRKEFAKIKKEEKADKKTVTATLKTFLGNSRALKYVSWLRISMGYRNYETEKYYVHFYHANKLFSEIEKRLKLGKEDLYFLSKDEIITGLRGKKNVSQIVKERKRKGFTIKQIGDKICVYTGVKKEDLYEEKIKDGLQILKGVGTYLGTENGKVKIILDPFVEGKHFRKNEILVTSMTTPEFVPLIKRAKAVVTDEGGLLCHAAIVSRELKKPCVIGTKIATKVLKDGNLVEVDANNGVVKILRKRKK